MIKPAISQTFSVLAAKEPISVDHIDSWYLREASGSAPSVTDSRWEFHNEGDPIPQPNPSLPYLWKKSVTYFTDGTKSDTVVEFCGGLGKNGIDYDLVPSHSSIVKSKDGALSPSNVSCAIIKRNADGSAEQLTSVPAGYSIEVRRNDSVVNSKYTPGDNISTSGTTSGITFILKYGTIAIERHNLNVIAEGAQGLTGRGIQSQDYRFKALSSASMPETPTNNSTWETWSALSQSGYSSSYPYLYRCIRTVYIDGNGNTSVEYVVDGPTVWGQTGNGIASVSYSHKYTMVFAAPSATDGGWIESSSSDYPTEAGLSKENRYLWERKRTIYTQSPSTYEVSLLAQFDSGLCENLLENTAFNDINDMDAWQIRNGYVVERALDNTNGFKKSPDTAAITDFLQQRIYRSGVIAKIQPSTWYTLSFYAYASLIYPIYNLSTPAYNSSSPYYGIGTMSSIYMESGQTITVSVTGYVASAAVKVIYYAWRQNSDGSWAQSRNAEFTSTSATTKTFTFTNTSGSAAQIYFRGYVYLATGSQNSSSATQNRGYISNVVIYRGAKLDTYLYRSDNGDAIVHDSAHPWIVNGVSVSSAKQMDDAFNTFPQMTGSYVYFSGDGHVRWQMTTGWKRYSVTFFTSSSLADDVEYRILFRLQGTGHETVIAKPKLERNTMPTEWIEHTNDRMAADFQHIYAGEWTSGTAYMYANGVRHVVRAKKSASGEKTFFRLKKRTSTTGYVSTSEPYSDTTYWEQASYLKFVATDLMLAEEVITDKLTVSKIRGAGGKFILDANGNVTGIGCVFDKVKVTGSLRNPFSVASGSFDVSYSDNVAVISSGGGWVDVYSLPWDISQSGRVIRIVNYKWGSTTSSGSASIGAASGKYFFEDGITKSELNISRELITLLGYGDNSTFYGWIVVNRIDLATTKRYGHNLKALAHGTIIGTSSTASLSNVRSFDKSSLSVSRQGVGWYRLTFPSTWFNSAESDLGLILTGRIIYNGTAPAKGSIKTISSTYVDILVSDDDTVNDGTVDFLIYNRDDFGIL